jgi:uncharacterized membrane protein YeiB
MNEILNKPNNAHLIGLDLARAFAILGMVLVNFKVTMGARESGPQWLHYLVSLFDGRAAALFVVLAGIGASLASRRARESGGSDSKRIARIRLAKRALFLFVLGWLFFPIWPADILHFYGAYLAIGAALLFVSNRNLWIIGVSAITISLVFLVTFDPFQNWDLNSLAYEGLFTPQGFIRNLFFDGFHPVFPWIAFYLFGMWLGRTNLSDKAWRMKLAIRAGAVVLISETLAFFSLGLRGSDHSNLDPQSARFLLSTDPIPPFPLYLMAGAGTAVLIIVLSLWIGEKASARAIEPLVSTGQLALTIYVGHVLVGMGILDQLGLLYDQSLTWVVVSSSIFSICAIAFSWLWRKRFSRGPLEGLMHRLLG